MTQPFWTLLGIDPTTERRAIRLAYSAALKGIDPETDPKAFIALREAYEAAQAEAAWIGSGPAAHDVAAEPVSFTQEDATADAYIARRPKDERWAAPAGEPETAAAPDPAQLHTDAITALLYRRHERPWLSEEDRKAILEHWAALTTDPRMEEIGFFDNVERWAANIVANAVPVSSPLIVPATRLFGWLDQQGKLAESPAAAEIVRLYWLRGQAEAAQRPGHVLHGAWIELTTRAFPGSNRGRVDPRAVFDLIAIIRQASPETEARLDPLRIAMWRNNTADPNSPESRAAREGQGRVAKWIVIGWLALTFFGMVLRAAGGG